MDVHCAVAGRLYINKIVLFVAVFQVKSRGRLHRTLFHIDLFETKTNFLYSKIGTESYNLELIKSVSENVLLSVVETSTMEP